jgi:hypothetical protein
VPGFAKEKLLITAESFALNLGYSLNSGYEGMKSLLIPLRTVAPMAAFDEKVREQKSRRSTLD